MTDLLEQVVGCLPPLPENTIDRIDKDWLDQLTTIYEYSRKGRLRELDGHRPKEWRGDGLHELSYMWGKLDAMTPDWLDQVFSEAVTMEHPFSPKSVKDRALMYATDEYTERLLRARAQPRAG